MPCQTFVESTQTTFMRTVTIVLKDIQFRSVWKNYVEKSGEYDKKTSRECLSKRSNGLFTLYGTGTDTGNGTRTFECRERSH